MATLRGGEAPNVYDIGGELLEAESPATIRALYAVLAAVWHSDKILLHCKRRLAIPIWKWKEDSQDCDNYRGVTLLDDPFNTFGNL